MAYTFSSSAKHVSAAAEVDVQEQEFRLEKEAGQALMFGEMYERYYNRVYYLALRYSAGNTAWAEDMAQEVFARVLECWDDLHDGVDPGPWLMRVTTNRCLNRLKREKVWQTLVPKWMVTQSASSKETPEVLADAKETLKRAYAMLEKLPAKERVVFSMYRLDQRTQEDIAGELGYSKGYVCKLIKRAEARIRQAGWRIDDE